MTMKRKMINLNRRHGALRRWAKLKKNPAHREQMRQKTPHKWWASINKDPVKLAAYYQKRKAKRLEVEMYFSSYRPYTKDQ
jgi:hypothetical protein